MENLVTKNLALKLESFDKAIPRDIFMDCKTAGGLCRFNNSENGVIDSRDSFLRIHCCEITVSILQAPEQMHYYNRVDNQIYRHASDWLLLGLQKPAIGQSTTVDVIEDETQDVIRPTIYAGVWST